MKNRIKRIRKEAGLTQKEFAEKLGIKQNTVATYEMGRIGVSDAVIISICREFNINEEWLRTGLGDMHSDADMDFADICLKIGMKDEKAKQAIIDYWNLSEDDKKTFWNFYNRFVK